MSIEEIFTTLTNHMLEGIMMHEQFIPYYTFLGLDGYSKCHEKHFKEESKNYRHIYCYYIKTYNKLLPQNEFKQPQIIPKSWLQYTRQEVDNNTKQNAVQQGLEHWLKWEKMTYQKYQELYKELISLNKIADAKEIEMLIFDVKNEVDKVEQYQLEKSSTNYDLIEIIKEQSDKGKSI